MALNLSWQRRSIIIFSGVTLVLGFILAALAVREAERGKLARERETERERQRYAALVTGEIDSFFSEIEKKMTAAIANSGNLQDIGNFSDICRGSSENEDLIGDIFLIGASNELVFPLRHPLFFTSERRRLADINLKKIEGTELFKTAESAELTAKNLPLAIQSYTTLIGLLEDDSLKAMVLNRLARCYLKSGNLKQALSTYNILLDNHSHELSSDGVLLGIIAFYQIASITQKIAPERAGPLILEFYSSLIGSEWPLAKPHFQFYRSVIQKLSDTWKMGGNNAEGNRDFNNRWSELEKEADKKLDLLTADEVLVEKVIPIVRTRVFKFNSETLEFSRFSEIVGDTLFLISAASVRKDTVLGIRMDNIVLIQDRLPMLQDSISIPEDWLVQIVDSHGRVISGESPLTSSVSDTHSPFVLGFNQDFPPWQIRIFQRNPRSLDRQYNLRRNVYILLVAAVMAIFFFGGFMIIRSTAKELELARLKSEFVSAVSHEFRTPLMSIRYLSEMLDAGRVEGENKKKHYYSKINKESERLSRLIENMLDFSKIEAGIKKYKFEDLSVKDLIKEIVSRFEEYMLDKEATMECEIPDRLPDIRADRDAILRAVFNLLDNAVKYSGKKPIVYLRIHVQGDEVLLDVQDKGTGISKDEQKKVFEKFYRSPLPAHRNIEGSGIGLTLVDHIVRAHGGEVLLESRVDWGTKVTLKLPISGKGNYDGEDIDR